jgi:hypothetical protein
MVTGMMSYLMTRLTPVKKKVGGFIAVKGYRNRLEK